MLDQLVAWSYAHSRAPSIGSRSSCARSMLGIGCRPTGPEHQVRHDRRRVWWPDVGRDQLDREASLAEARSEVSTLPPPAQL